MKTVKKYAGLTAQDIIIRQDGETRGDHRMTGDIIWTFRTDLTPDGYISDDLVQCEPKDATCIAIEGLGGIGPRLDLTAPVSEYMREIGAKGGKAGIGSAKSRSSEQTRKASLSRRNINRDKI